MYKLRKGPSPKCLTGDDCVNEKNRINSIVKSGRTLLSTDFDNKLYGHEDVKSELRRLHDNRCAYCGCSLQGSHFPIEHYRPKTAYKNARNSPLVKPGYYWLAYDWDNLLCSCDECNSAKFKGNLFPLIDENKRNIKGKDISQEIPVLINPAIDDPNDYLEYDTWIVLPKSGIGVIEESRAKGTIDILCLNGERIENGLLSFPRASLVDERKKEWDKFCTMVKYVMDSKPEYTIEEARKLVVEKLNLVSGPYGFMFQKWA